MRRLDAMLVSQEAGHAEAARERGDLDDELFWLAVIENRLDRPEWRLQDYA